MFQGLDGNHEARLIQEAFVRNFRHPNELNFLASEQLSAVECIRKQLEAAAAAAAAAAAPEAEAEAAVRMEAEAAAAVEAARVEEHLRRSRQVGAMRYMECVTLLGSTSIMRSPAGPTG